MWKVRLINEFLSCMCVVSLVFSWSQIVTMFSSCLLVSKSNRLISLSHCIFPLHFQLWLSVSLNLLFSSPRNRLVNLVSRISPFLCSRSSVSSSPWCWCVCMWLKVVFSLFLSSLISFTFTVYTLAVNVLSPHRFRSFILFSPNAIPSFTLDTVFSPQQPLLGMVLASELEMVQQLLRHNPTLTL